MTTPFHSPVRLLSVMLVALAGFWAMQKVLLYQRQDAVLEQFVSSIAAVDPHGIPEVTKTEPVRHRWLRYLIGKGLYYTIDGIYFVGASDSAGPSLVYVAQLPCVNELDLSMTKVSDSLHSRNPRSISRSLT